MREIFDRMAAEAGETTTELSVAYLELFNESLRDLLADPPSTASLNMREQDGRVVVPGLSEHTPKTAEEVIGMIHAGNLNRTVASTEANATSSRSHAVMTVSIRRKSRTADISEDWSVATLSVIDVRALWYDWADDAARGFGASVGDQERRRTAARGASAHQSVHVPTSALPGAARSAATRPLADAHPGRQHQPQPARPRLVHQRALRPEAARARAVPRLEAHPLA